MSAAAPAVLDTVRARRGGRSARVRDAVLEAARQELMERGYEHLSHLGVARRSGVDPATVHRRWPTRVRLALDAVIDLAITAVPVPDTGTLRGDLTVFHRAVAALLRDPPTLRLFQAFSAATFDQDSEVTSALQAFWRTRLDGATAMLDRAVGRGEISEHPEPRRVVEQLVAPAYFRALVSRGPLDEELTEHSVGAALRLVEAS